MLASTAARDPSPVDSVTGRGAPRNALAAILGPADILLGLDTPTKNRAFQQIARFMASRQGVVEADVYEGLAEREKLGSTGIGYGIAIPHARIPGLARPVAAYVRTELPIPFDAPDGRPVGDMLILLVPEEATDEHLELLAEVADLFRDRSLRERLRGSSDPLVVHAMLTGAQVG
ncbi:MAG TPA: PTS sugar transporter subunit IIA [Casimicrobiaceae bacterium]|nr:PTS sugar transporter subunit IIA [Casimicrobiaceae bacterium]